MEPGPGPRRGTACHRIGVCLGRAWTQIPRLRGIQFRISWLLPGALLLLPGLLLPTRSGLLLSRYRPVAARVRGTAGRGACGGDAELLVLLPCSKGILPVRKRLPGRMAESAASAAQLRTAYEENPLPDSRYFSRRLRRPDAERSRRHGAARQRKELRSVPLRRL